MRTPSLLPRSHGRVAVALWLAALLLPALLLPAQAPAADRTQPRPHGEKVAIDPALVDVGDGDTVTIRWSADDSERVRVLGIDTPEIAHPRYGMPHDQYLGKEAAAFAQGAFAAAERIELLRAAETDGYGRTLGYLFVNGKNYSVLVVRAGLAAETVSHYGDNGLPEPSEAVLAASREVAPPVFEPPYQFRRRMREVREWEEAREEARREAAGEAGEDAGGEGR